MDDERSNLKQEHNSNNGFSFHTGSAYQSSVFIPSKGRLTSTSSRPMGSAKGYKHVLLPLAIAANTVAMATARSIPVL